MNSRIETNIPSSRFIEMNRMLSHEDWNRMRFLINIQSKRLYIICIDGRLALKMKLQTYQEYFKINYSVDLP